MTFKNIRSDEERSILTALIVHDEVLATVHSRLGDERQPFESKWSNLVAQWCLAYYGKYRRAPRKHVQQMFQRYAEKVNDKDAIALVEAFLGRLSKDYEGLAKEMNENYVLDLASAYFERVRLARYADSLQQALEARDLDEAREQVAAYRAVDFSTKAWVDPFSEEEIRKTLRFYEKDRVLVQFPGDLGQFLSPFFERSAFIAFAAPEKRGKSYWLQECVCQALRQRRKVLYYVLGDMSLEQVKRRLYGRLARRPIKAGKIRVPVDFEAPSKDGPPRVKFQTTFREALSVKAIMEAVEGLKRSTATK